jgi:hypothetical protein
MVYVKDLIELTEVYNNYVAQFNKLYELYSQGVPVVVPSTSSVPVNSQKDTGTRAKRSRTRVKL